MDKNTKIAFGVVGALWLWGMYKQFRLYERVVSIDMTFAQYLYDEKFEEIAEEIGDIGEFPDDS